ncbi:hypothetical protein EVAR_96382_1 [Eumeta japonica]|uniref:Uncharacterized protein n=1 Tax=Eumeta variegata TaxID=151549 RepID=A0A4C1WDZ3_EUMVA|nr:hypothetical protein EVAR_96382_1 [Eumeta japonica]
MEKIETKPTPFSRCGQSKGGATRAQCRAKRGHREEMSTLYDDIRGVVGQSEGRVLTPTLSHTLDVITRVARPSSPASRPRLTTSHVAGAARMAPHHVQDY